MARISSQVQCIPDSGSVLLGLRFIKDVGEKGAQLIVEERGRNGPYAGAGDLVRRTGLKSQAVLSLTQAGAFDGLTPTAGRPYGRQGSPLAPPGMGKGP